MQFISKRKLKNLNYKFQQLEMWQKGLIALAGFIVVSTVVSFCGNRLISRISNSVDPTTTPTEQVQQNSQPANDTSQNTTNEANNTNTENTSDTSSQNASDTGKSDADKGDANNGITGKTPRLNPHEKTLSKLFETDKPQTIKINKDASDYKAKRINENTLFEINGIRCYTSNNISIIPINMANALKDLIKEQKDYYPQPIITDFLDVDVSNTYQYLVNVIAKDTSNKVYIIVCSKEDKGYKIVDADSDLIMKFTDGEAVDYHE